MPKSVTVEQGQCMMDIAIQHCGDATAIFEIAELNGIGATDLVQAGSSIIVPDPYNQSLVDYLAENKEVPATGDASETIGVAPLTGIDYWAIEIDFIVQ